MILDFSQNKLSIEDISLKSYQKSQLSAWGFRNSGENYLEFVGENADRILPKVLRYFQKEKLDYETTPECASKIDQISKTLLTFQNFKVLGESFKNGGYDNETFKEFKKFLKTYVHRKLKSHQIKAAFHLYIVSNGANFSVPGSGKTSVVLSVYEKLKHEGKVNVLFVVGPVACFGPWRNEFTETLRRDLNYRVLAGGDKCIRKGEYYASESNKAELYLTTFQTLINDQTEINTFFSQDGINVFLVIDEAHYIKQVNGNWASAVLNISKHSKFRCVLTGTPIPKSFSDIYNLFDFLWPENEPIESRAKIILQRLERNNEIEEAKKILDSKVGLLFYRVRKKDLHLKEPQFHDPIILQMNKYEQMIYDAIEKKIKSYVIDDYLLNIDFVNGLKRGRIMRLRQSVSYISLLNKAIENYDEDLLKNEKDLRHIIRNYNKLEIPAKLEYLTKKIKDLRTKKEKVVVWTNFVGTIEKLEKYFNEELGLYCRSIYGKTPIEQTSLSDELTREQVRDEFVDQTSGLDILIANPAACAESISLHKTCHNAIYYDLSYNCAQYLQSLDRIHRVGGSENIVANYFFLQYKNSIDQDILKNLRRKAERMSRIIDSDYEIYALDMFDDENDELTAYNRLFDNK